MHTTESSDRDYNDREYRHTSIILSTGLDVLYVSHLHTLSLFSVASQHTALGLGNRARAIAMSSGILGHFDTVDP